jgi:hypothetical protein
MIGRSSGLRVTVSFGPFAMVPPKAMEGLQRMIQHALETYGLAGVVVADGTEADANARWWEYVQKLDADVGDCEPK